MTGGTDLPVRSTAEFLLAHLGPPPTRVLVIGCGSGAVSALVHAVGHEIVAIDADPAMVAAARTRGINARCAHWPDFADDDFSAVAFTRSLHHITPLMAAVLHAGKALRPGGVLLVEDFDIDAMDAATMHWFTAALQALDRDGHLLNRPSALACKLLTAEDPAAVWRSNHGRDLHAFPAIEDAVHSVLRPGRRSEVPYLFRYVAEVLTPGEAADGALAALYAEEEHRGARGETQRIGRRLVAHAPPAA